MEQHGNGGSAYHLSNSQRRMIRDSRADGSEDLWLSTELRIPQSTVKLIRISLQGQGKEDRDRVVETGMKDVCQLEFISYAEDETSFGARQFSHSNKNERKTARRGKGK